MGDMTTQMLSPRPRLNSNGLRLLIDYNFHTKGMHSFPNICAIFLLNCDLYRQNYAYIAQTRICWNFCRLTEISWKFGGSTPGQTWAWTSCAASIVERILTARSLLRPICSCTEKRLSATATASHTDCWFSASAGMAQSMPFEFPSNDMAREKNLVKYVWLILVVLFGCLFPPPILWEHLSEIESGWELLSDTSPPLCESIWVHYEQLWVNKSLDRRKSHWISLVPFGCNWGHLSNWSINN